MLSPRLFSHPAEQTLLPETMGVERFVQQTGPLFAKRSYRCEISGYQSGPGKEGASSANSLSRVGFMMLEYRDPRLTGKEANAASNLRVMDSMTFWSRHVDLAVKHRKGNLIFAPWLSQSEITSIFRSASMALALAKESSDQAKFASGILDIFSNLQNAELLVSALGLEGSVKEWNEEEWLTSLKKLPAKARKQYMEAFGRHVRFLPCKKAFSDAISHWGGLAQLQSSRRSWDGHMLAEYTKLNQSMASGPA